MSEPDTPQPLSVRLAAHIASMAPHQKERHAGRLLIEAREGISALEAGRPTPGTVAERHQERELELSAEQIRRLEFSLGQADRIAADQAARVAELEAERDRLAQERDVAMKLGADNLAAARARVAELGSERDRLATALAFYADPDTYFAMTILVDAPAGAFVEDFDEDHGGDYDRPMPGKRARAALAGEEEQS